MTCFVIIFTIIFTYLCYRNLRIGIFLIVGFLPAYLIRLSLFGVSSTLLELMIFCLFIVWFRKKRSRGFEVFYKSVFFLPTLGFLLASFAALFWSPDFLKAFGLWRAYFLEPVVFFVIFIDLIKKPKDIKNILAILGGEILYLSIYGLYQYFSGDIPLPWSVIFEKRITSFFEYPNALALFITPIIVLYFGMIIGGVNIFKNKKADILFKILVVIPGIISLLLSKSRGGIISFFAGIIFMLIFFAKYNHYRKKITIILSFGFVCFFLLILYPVFRNNFLDEVFLRNNSGQVRTALWQAGGKMLVDNPVQGVGISGFPFLYEKYKLARHTEILLYPHNIVLNFWLEIGAVGLFFFLWVLWGYFIRYNKDQYYSPILRIILIGTMFVLIFHGFVDVPYFKNDLALLFWVFVGLMEAQKVCHPAFGSET